MIVKGIFSQSLRAGVLILDLMLVNNLLLVPFDLFDESSPYHPSYLTLYLQKQRGNYLTEVLSFALGLILGKRKMHTGLGKTEKNSLPVDSVFE